MPPTRRYRATVRPTHSIASAFVGGEQLREASSPPTIRSRTRGPVRLPRPMSTTPLPEASGRRPTAKPEGRSSGIRRAAMRRGRPELRTVPVPCGRPMASATLPPALRRSCCQLAEKRTSSARRLRGRTSSAARGTPAGPVGRTQYGRASVVFPVVSPGGARIGDVLGNWRTANNLGSAQLSLFQ